MTSLVLGALAAGPAGAQPSGYPRWEQIPSKDFLVYSRSEDDIGRPNLSCAMTAPNLRVSMFTSRRPTGDTAAGRGVEPDYYPVTMTVRSKGVSAELPGRAIVPSSDARFQMTVVYAEIPAGHPLIKSLAETGDITLTALGDTVTVPPAPLDKVSQMLEACGKR